MDYAMKIKNNEKRGRMDDRTEYKCYGAVPYLV